MDLKEWVNNYVKEVTHSHEYEDMSQMGEDENDPQEINVGNYQTKYFHVCPGASKLYGDIESKGVDMDMAERSVRLQDALYFIEEHIQRDGYKPERDYVMVAKNIAKNIMKMANMMGLEKEHDYIQGHIDTIEKVVKEKGLEEGDGLWANIRAKQKRGEKPAHGNSQAHKDAVKAGKKINKESVSEGSESDSDMATSQLETSIKKAQELIAKLRGKGDLEPWVQSLITKAEDYISTVTDYSEVDEYDVETMDELNDFHNFMKECKSSVNEAEYQGRNVELGKIMQGDVKKFKVYVNNDKGNVVKVNFGQKGMVIKKDNPDARKSFRARMNCDEPGPRWKARYWSCRKW
jgi:hypothetical protein